MLSRNEKSPELQGFFLLRLVSGFDQRDNDADGKYSEGYGQREPCLNVNAEKFKENFGADKDQNNGQRLLQVCKAVDGLCQKEVKRAQAENGKDVAGIYDVDILRNQEYCGDAVYRKNDVHSLNDEQGKKQRGDKMAFSPADEEMFSVQALGNVEFLTDKPVHSAFGQRAVLFLGNDHFDAGVNQEEREQV